MIDQSLLVSGASVLTVLIGMVEQISRGSALDQDHGQADDLLGIQAITVAR